MSSNFNVRLLASQLSATAAVGALAGSTVMGLSASTGAALAATVFAVQTVAQQIVLRLSKRDESLLRSTTLSGVHMPALILNGSLLHTVLRLSGSKLPLFHAFAFASACGWAGRVIGLYFNAPRQMPQSTQ